MRIPVIDIFAGPGGLSEGFSAPINGVQEFDVRLSVEMTSVACRTLETRAFYREFRDNNKQIPQEYYAHLRGEITQEELFATYPFEAKNACSRICQAQLGSEEGNLRVAQRGEALKGKDSVLIGGPPCQAYSIVGRSRSLGAAEKSDNPVAAREKFYLDHRHTLYKEYLRIIQEYQPAIFIMENVVGILSAKLNGVTPVFTQIRQDLRCALGKDDSYRLFSFRYEEPMSENDDPRNFLLKCEDFGVPQKRHRVIVLGLRKDVALANGNKLPQVLETQRIVTVRDVLEGMPLLRSEFSRCPREKNTFEAWKSLLSSARLRSLLKCEDFRLIDDKIQKTWKKLKKQETREGWLDIEPETRENKRLKEWYRPINSRGIPVANHCQRAHMKSDIERYHYMALTAYVTNHSPRIYELPKELLPNHKNVLKGKNKKEQAFADRFKVQLWDEPSSTITCHISKDGHYFIHPDPAQSRSLSVREAARLQTFPDDYFFEGNRTEQFHQVGNAVPAYLANQMAAIVCQLYRTWERTRKPLHKK